MSNIDKSLSGHDIIQELGKRFAQYRKRMKMTQKQVAEQSGLSVFTISGFENGSQTGISLASYIRLLRALDLVELMDQALPELTESPREAYYKSLKKHSENNKYNN